MLPTEREKLESLIKSAIISKLISKTNNASMLWKKEDRSNCYCHPEHSYVSRDESGFLYVYSIRNGYLDIYFGETVAEGVARIRDVRGLIDLQESIEKKLNPESVKADLESHHRQMNEYQKVANSLKI